MARILFVTQRLHEQDAFLALWAEAFVELGHTVEMVLLEDRHELTLPTLGREPGELPFAIHSLGKERGYGRARWIARFLRLAIRLRYDRVFVHGYPVWALIGAPVWIARRVPTYLWYTHYTMEPGVWALARYGRRMFCATPQSLPQFDGSPKKIVTGHGIDLSFWPQRANEAPDPYRLLAVHRLSRSKRVELLVRAVALLPERYGLDVYGNEPDAAYASELRALASELGVGERISWHGTVPARELTGTYRRHRLMLNMASETIDKAMLEAMTCGCYPVVTPRNAEAIGIPAAPGETPEAIAAFVERHAERGPLGADAMYAIVAERHSLRGLVRKLDRYIGPGV